MGKSICETCKNITCMSYSTRADMECVDYERMTWGDIIRVMSDEELAEWHIKIQNDVVNYFACNAEREPKFPTQIHTWLDWLKSPVEVET